MSFGIFKIEMPKNEPILSYAPGTPERAEIKAKLEELKSRVIEIPVISGGKEYWSNETVDVVIPHNHKHVLAKAHLADRETLKEVVSNALEAKQRYLELPWDERASLFMRAADLISGPWRAILNAATMLGLSKTVYEAEIDSACELIDMLRFNTYWMSEIYQQQPISSKDVWNRLEYRPLDGFVLAITPFNFASIAGNLPTAPAIMGNVVVWKPASNALYPAYFIMKVLEEAGVPEGVINFVPVKSSLIDEVVLDHPDLGGVHFTGSTNTMKHIWRRIGENINEYKQYPRIVGETGGKDFVFAHKSTDIDALVAALIRGAFEYQGQKCSAASRAYIPKSLWPQVKEKLLREIRTIKVGDPADFTNFMAAIIDKAQFDKIVSYIKQAKEDSNYEILCGGTYDDAVGYFVQPTVVLSKDPKAKLMSEEIFGPVLTIYLYDGEKYEETLKLCDETSSYGLTGSIFATDREALTIAERILRFAAGNFYRNDKPTGAVIAQQPFGGSRGSGTNDKAGSFLNLLRWTSVRTIKENFVPPTDYRRPFMAQP
jgi:1-pyrroline-5-carboxylate dehydrogenase